jgi:hypothetical protein
MNIKEPYYCAFVYEYIKGKWPSAISSRLIPKANAFSASSRFVCKQRLIQKIAKQIEQVKEQIRTMEKEV